MHSDHAVWEKRIDTNKNQLHSLRSRQPLQITVHYKPNTSSEALYQGTECDAGVGCGGAREDKTAPTQTRASRETQHDRVECSLKKLNIVKAGDSSCILPEMVKVGGCRAELTL